MQGQPHSDDPRARARESALDELLDLWASDRDAGCVAPLQHYSRQLGCDAAWLEAELQDLNRSLSAPSPIAHDGNTRREPFTAGQRFGDFTLLRRLGRGSQGVVFAARDERLQRQVALKIFFGHGILSSEGREAFLREGQLAARLSHPNVAQVHAAGVVGPWAWLAMRFVRGESLAHQIASTATAPAPEAQRDAVAPMLRRLARMAEGLHAAHEAGVVHRDLTPHNIAIDEGHEWVILDFGLALEAAQHSTKRTEDTPQGTHAHMAPEQRHADASGHYAIDRRADIFALGVLLFELLTLRKPFRQAEGAKEALATLPRLGTPQLQDDVGRILRSSLAFEREDRYPSARAFADDLGRVARGHPSHGHPPRPAWRMRAIVAERPLISTLVGVLTLVLLGAQAFAWAHLERERELRESIEASRADLSRTYSALARQSRDEAIRDFESNIVRRAPKPALQALDRIDPGFDPFARRVLEARARPEAFRIRIAEELTSGALVAPALGAPHEAWSVIAGGPGGLAIREGQDRSYTVTLPGFKGPVHVARSARSPREWTAWVRRQGKSPIRIDGESGALRVTPCPSLRHPARRGRAASYALMDGSLLHMVFGQRSFGVTAAGRPMARTFLFDPVNVPTHASLLPAPKALLVAERNATGGGRIRQVSAHTPPHTLVAFDTEHPTLVATALNSPLGAAVLTDDNSRRASLLLFDQAGNTLARAQVPPRVRLQQLALAPDGRHVVAATGEGSLLLFETPFEYDPLWIAGNGASVLATRFAPDSRSVATLCSDGWLRVYPIEGARRCLPLPLAHPIRCAASADRQSLLSLSANGRLEARRMDGLREGPRIVARSVHDFWPLDGSLLALLRKKGRSFEVAYHHWDTTNPVHWRALATPSEDATSVWIRALRPYRSRLRDPLPIHRPSDPVGRSGLAALIFPTGTASKENGRLLWTPVGSTQAQKLGEHTLLAGTRGPEGRPHLLLTSHAEGPAQLRAVETQGRTVRFGAAVSMPRAQRVSGDELAANSDATGGKWLALESTGLIRRYSPHHGMHGVAIDAEQGASGVWRMGPNGPVALAPGYFSPRGWTVLGEARVAPASLRKHASLLHEVNEESTRLRIWIELMQSNALEAWDPEWMAHAPSVASLLFGRHRWFSMMVDRRSPIRRRSVPLMRLTPDLFAHVLGPLGHPHLRAELARDLGGPVDHSPSVEVPSWVLASYRARSTNSSSEPSVQLPIAARWLLTALRKGFAPPIEGSAALRQSCDDCRLWLPEAELLLRRSELRESWRSLQRLEDPNAFWLASRAWFTLHDPTRITRERGALDLAVAALLFGKSSSQDPEAHRAALDVMSQELAMNSSHDLHFQGLRAWYELLCVPPRDWKVAPHLLTRLTSEKRWNKVHPFALAAAARCALSKGQREKADQLAQAARLRAGDPLQRGNYAVRAAITLMRSSTAAGARAQN